MNISGVMKRECVCVKGRGRQTVKKRGDSGGKGLREV